MSRGLGRIERGIAAIMDGEPDEGFTVAELCQWIYTDAPITKQQRVAVLRAARSLARRRPSLVCFRSLARGGALVFCCEDNGEMTLDFIDRVLLRKPIAAAQLAVLRRRSAEQALERGHE